MVAAVVGLYALLPAIALSAMPVTQGADGEFTTALGTEFADDPVLGIVQNLGLGAGLTDALEVYVGILAAVILLIATNAALIGLSRLTFSMGQYRQLPEALRQIHPKFKTPVCGVDRVLGRRDSGHGAGPDDVPGDDLCVRRDALVHGRARLGDPAAKAETGRRQAQGKRRVAAVALAGKRRRSGG